MFMKILEGMRRSCVFADVYLEVFELSLEVFELSLEWLDFNRVCYSSRQRERVYNVQKSDKKLKYQPVVVAELFDDTEECEIDASPVNSIPILVNNSGIKTIDNFWNSQIESDNQTHHEVKNSVVFKRPTHMVSQERVMTYERFGSMERNKMNRGTHYTSHIGNSETYYMENMANRANRLIENHQNNQRKTHHIPRQNSQINFK